MDINTSYEYEGSQSFKWNECEEVQLQAVSADDFSAVVQDITKSNTNIENYIVAQYRIYNFSGLLSIDTSYYENLSDDVEVLIMSQNDTELERIKTTVEDTSVKLEYSFDNSNTYELYIAKPNEGNTIQKLISRKNKTSSSNVEEAKERGKGLLYGPTFFGLFNQIHLNVWVEDIGEYTDYEKQALVNEINHNWIADSRIGITSLDDPRISVVDGKKIDTRLNLLRKIVPFCEYTSDDDIRWWHVIYAYKSLENEEEYDQLIEAKKEAEEKEENSIRLVKTGFDVVKDEFPFANFGSYISPEGNCAGISSYTAMLFNQGSVPSQGHQDGIFREYSYETSKLAVKVGEVVWDISPYEDAQTLLNQGVSDYKDDQFLQTDFKDYYDEDRRGNEYIYRVPNYEHLEADEQSFVDMIGCYQHEANTVYTYGCIDGMSNYSYQTIEVMKEYLDNGQVIKLATNVLAGGAHMIVVYGYEYNENNPDQTVFYIYDSNLPNYSSDTCRMVVTRLKSSVGYEDTFSFDYWPDPEGTPDDRLTSFVGYGEEYYFEVTDDHFNILNVN